MQYFLRRVLVNIPVLFLVTIVIYLLINLAPGDPVDFFVNEEIGITKEDLDFVRERYGLDDPLPVRYVKWLGQVVRGDLGFRFKNGDDVREVLIVRMQRTFTLMGTSLAMGIFVGVTLGIFIGLRQYSMWDFTFTGLSFVGISMPAFIAAIFGLYIFSVKLGWFPSGGMRTIGKPESLLDMLYHLVLPAGTLAIFNVATFMRYTRFSMLEVRGEDYVRTAKAKGLKPPTRNLASCLSQRPPPYRDRRGSQPAHAGSGRALYRDNLQLAGHGRSTCGCRRRARLSHGHGHHAGYGACCAVSQSDHRSGLRGCRSENPL